jgi:hypothetical protein
MRPLVHSEAGGLMTRRNNQARWVNIRAMGIVASTALFVFAQPVLGQLTNEPAKAQQPAQDTAPKARITKRDCKRLIRHRARADVAYKPGVDVRGNPVVPADASGRFTIPLPDVFEFHVTKDLTTYLGADEDQLAADKATAIAAEKTVAATKAAVTSAELSLAGAQSIADNTAAAATAAKAAADAAPNDATLAAAAATAQQTAAIAAAGLASTQTAVTATTSASTSNDTAAALASAQLAKAAAEEIGYVPDATAISAATAAQTTATDAAVADSAAAAAAQVVASSEGMTLNVGTVRFNIKTGGMTFNGKPLNDASMSELAEKCQAMMAAGK